MHTSTTKAGVKEAVDRCFRKYTAYVNAQSDDSLFDFLNAVHSLDDKLAQVSLRLFFGIEEYLVMKALRNLYHHEQELRNKMHVKHVKGLDVGFDFVSLCLVSTADCQAAIAGVKPRFQPAAQAAFNKTVMQYGTVADINPCIFNGMVKIYEVLALNGIYGISDEYSVFKDCYDFEQESAMPHYVNGRLTMHASTCSKVIAALEQAYFS